MDRYDLPYYDKVLLVSKSWVDNLFTIVLPLFEPFLDDPEWFASWKVSNYSDDRQPEGIQFLDRFYKTPTKDFFSSSFDAIGWLIASCTDEWETKGLQEKERCAVLEELGFKPFGIRRLQRYHTALGIKYRSHK